MKSTGRNYTLGGQLPCGLGALLLALALSLLAGCGPVRLIANTNIPTPLVVKMPIAVALFIPKEFSSYVHNEERWSTDWHVELGKAQSEGITRLMNAMFERVVAVDSVGAGASSGVRAILEPSIEEFAFVTPRDAASPFFAVSIKYRVNIYLPDGKLADSWGFTGYGTAPAEGLSSAPPLQTATALAMRDAGAKLAVEFREQATVRGLLPEGTSVDSRPVTGLPAPAPAPSDNGSSNAAAPSDPVPAGAAAAPPGASQPVAAPKDDGAEDEAQKEGQQEAAPPGAAPAEQGSSEPPKSEPEQSASRSILQ